MFYIVMTYLINKWLVIKKQVLLTLNDVVCKKLHEYINLIGENVKTRYQMLIIMLLSQI
jgi:hypothetical protein